MYGSLGSSGPPSRSARPKKERKVSVIFRSSENGQHSGGLTSLALAEGSGGVFTSSRDFTVKRWSADGGRLRPEATFEGHTDWVNDVAVLNAETLASASADQSVRLWHAGSNGQASFVLLEHTDHVTTLAAAPAAGVLATGGLSSQLFLWDIQTATRLQQEYHPHPAPGLKDSVYSLAISGDGSVVASGAPEACIRITDPRTDRKLMKLRGHTANIRALALNEAGTMCISGSTDHTLRVWDLGQQRCVATLAVHEDSVWSLAMDAGFAIVTSGGRDGCIYRTNLAQRTSELVCRDLGPVRRLALAPDGRLWSASEAAGLTAWPPASSASGLAALPPGGKLPPPRTRPGSGGGGSGSPARSSPAAAAAASGRASPAQAAAARPASTRGGVAGGAGSSPRRPVPGSATPVQGSPSRALSRAGSAGGAAGKSSPAQRPAAAGAATAAGAAPATPGGRAPAAGASPGQLRPSPAAHPGGGGSFMAAASPAMRARQSVEGDPPTPLFEAPLCAARPAAALREAAMLQDQRHIVTRDADGNVALWDVTTGMVVRRRGQGPLANAVRDMFMPMVVAPWCTLDVSSGNLAVTMDPTQEATFVAEVYATELGNLSAPDNERLGFAEQMAKGLFWDWAQKSGHATSGSRPALDPHRQHRAGRAAFEFWEGTPAPLVASTTAAGKPWRRLAGGFDGGEDPGDVVPGWVAEIVVRGRLPAKPEDKFAFVLQPAPVRAALLPTSFLRTQGSGLPPLTQARLNAPAIMRAAKIAPYTLAELKVKGVVLDPPVPVYLDAQQQRREAPPRTGASTLELTCLGKAVPSDLSLAAMKKFIWRREDDIVIEYRVMDPARPALLPVIDPSA